MNTTVRTLRFLNKDDRESFLQNQRTANWRAVVRHSDGTTVTIDGISVHQIAKAIDGYDAIKL